MIMLIFHMAFKVLTVPEIDNVGLKAVTYRVALLTL